MARGAATWPPHCPRSGHDEGVLPVGRGEKTPLELTGVAPKGAAATLAAVGGFQGFKDSETRPAKYNSERMKAPSHCMSTVGHAVCASIRKERMCSLWKGAIAWQGMMASSGGPSAEVRVEPAQGFDGGVEGGH